MRIERPNIDEFVKMVNDLADVQDDLNKKEYEYKKLVANCKRDALASGAKTREVENVEFLGNNKEEEAKLDKLMLTIFDRKKAVRILWGKLEAWKSQRDLYRTDSYHEVTGSRPLGKSSDFFGSEEET
jgi:hypothetical protein